jgi:ferric-dicitrate binding protein FerR (iron transport regulator)
MNSGHSPADWLAAALVFQGAPLDEVAAVLASRYDMQVRVPRGLANRTVTAWFASEPSAHFAISVICRAVGARCAIVGRVAEMLP